MNRRKTRVTSRHLALLLVCALALPNFAFALRVSQEGSGLQELQRIVPPRTQDTAVDLEELVGNPVQMDGKFHVNIGEHIVSELEGQPLSQILRRLRDSVYASGKEIADATETPLSTYYHWERGVYKPPRASLRKLADYYIRTRGLPSEKVSSLFGIQPPEEILKALSRKPLPEILRALRESIPLFQEQIAQGLGVAIATYQTWEYGEIMPSNSQLRKIAGYYSQRHGFPQETLLEVFGFKTPEQFLGDLSGKELSKILHDLRHFAGQTQKQMARVTGVPKTTYASWEMGHRPSLVHRQRLAYYYVQEYGFPQDVLAKALNLKPPAEVLEELANKKNLAEALFTLRDSQGLLQYQVAASIGVVEGAYQHWESGGQAPRLTNLRKLVTYYNEKHGFPFDPLFDQLVALLKVHRQMGPKRAIVDTPMLIVTVNNRRFRVPARGVIGNHPLNFRQLFNLLTREKLLDYESAFDIEERLVSITRLVPPVEGLGTVAKILGSAVTTEQLNRLGTFSFVRDNDEINIGDIRDARRKRRRYSRLEPGDASDILNPVVISRNGDAIEVRLVAARTQTRGGKSRNRGSEQPAAGLEEGGVVVEVTPGIFAKQAQALIQEFLGSSRQSIEIGKVALIGPRALEGSKGLPALWPLLVQAAPYLTLEERDAVVVYTENQALLKVLREAGFSKSHSRIETIRQIFLPSQGVTLYTTPEEWLLRGQFPEVSDTVLLSPQTFPRALASLLALLGYPEPGQLEELTDALAAFA